MKDLILATVNDKINSYGVTSGEFAAIAPNIPMGLLDAYVTGQGIPSIIMDADADNLSFEVEIEKIIDSKPLLVGIIISGSNPSASTQTMGGVIKFFKELNRRELSFSTFIYGGHPTVLPERSLKETGADYVVSGEGYETVTQLYKCLAENLPLDKVPGLGFFEKDVFRMTPAPPLIDLDDIPQIRWDQMNPNKYKAHNWHCFDDIENRTPYAIIHTNQGCPYPCEFCCINNLFEKRTFRFRSMKKVVEEIDVLVNEYGVKNLKILDELFVIKHPRIDEFCDLLDERGYDLNMWCFARVDSVTPRILKRLKKVGLNWIAYGFESIDDDVFSTTNKRVKKTSSVQETIDMTRDAGINIVADVIAGLWPDNEETILKTRDFLYANNFEFVNIYPCFAYPGTPLYDNYIRDGIIPVPTNWETYGLYSYETIPLPTKYLNPDEVLRLRDEIFSSYYQDEKILNMIEEKFGTKARDHVKRMAETPLKRKILEPGYDASKIRYDANNKFVKLANY
jgi:anaerobic magnesium-protoporphyrin IX monomethyl ester cyclase